MQITQEEVLQMVAAIVAGAASNPAHSHLINDSYGMQQAIYNTLNAVQQAMVQAGVEIAQ